MLIIICGEDNVSSRNYFLTLQQEYKDKQYEMAAIPAAEISMLLSDAAMSPNLFGQQRVYITENLNKNLSRKKGSNSVPMVEIIEKNKDVILIDWEDGVQGRELKTGKIGLIKEFRPESSIFKLLDNCYPAKMKDFLVQLGTLTTSQNEMFIYLMILRHMRNVLLLSSKASLPGLQSWQVGKLKRQAQLWQPDKLLSFYEKLVRIEISLKSGQNPYGIKRSLELLGCYYL